MGRVLTKSIVGLEGARRRRGMDRPWGYSSQLAVLPPLVGRAGPARMKCRPQCLRIDYKVPESEREGVHEIVLRQADNAATSSGKICQDPDSWVYEQEVEVTSPLPELLKARRKRTA